MNLLRVLLAVSSLTLVSRILGYVRDFFIARAFGAGLATDAFFVAFRIPNLLRRLFAEGAFSQAFVPVLADYKNRQTPEQTKTLVAAVLFAQYFDPPVVALAWAVFAGGVLQLALQVPYLRRMGLLPRWRLDLSHPGVRRILKLMAPAAFGVSISQVSLLINTIFAS